MREAAVSAAGTSTEEDLSELAKKIRTVMPGKYSFVTSQNRICVIIHMIFLLVLFVHIIIFEDRSSEFVINYSVRKSLFAE